MHKDLAGGEFLFALAHVRPSVSAQAGWVPPLRSHSFRLCHFISLKFLLQSDANGIRLDRFSDFQACFSSSLRVSEERIAYLSGLRYFLEKVSGRVRRIPSSPPPCPWPSLPAPNCRGGVSRRRPPELLAPLVLQAHLPIPHRWITLILAPLLLPGSVLPLRLGVVQVNVSRVAGVQLLRDSNRVFGSRSHIPV